MHWRNTKERNKPWYLRGKPATRTQDFFSFHSVAQELALQDATRPVILGRWDGTCSLPWQEVHAAMTEITGAPGVIIDHEEQPFEYSVTYLLPNGALRLNCSLNDHELSMQAVTQDEDLYRHLESWARWNVSDECLQDSVYTVVASKDGSFDTNVLDFAGVPLARQNYTASVLEKYDRAVAALNATESNGRIVVLDGVPGTGKTYLVRAMVHDVRDTMFIVMPQGMVEALVGPSMIPLLLSLRAGNSKSRIVFILEDADDALVPRDGGNVHLISALLNFGDGFLGQALDVRIIATTNQPADKIDPAVKRPGRLIEHIHVGPLSQQEAQQVLRSLNPNAVLPARHERSFGFSDAPVSSTYTLAEVYEAARASA